MYADGSYQYYDWNSIPIRVPVSGGEVEMYSLGEWKDPPGVKRALSWYMKPGGEGAAIENAAELKALIKKCDARDA